jgi:hypothetical protein
VPLDCEGFTITLRHTTLDRTPLDEWSAKRRDVYLTTHNTHKRWTSMPLAGFEPTIPASERLQTQALDHVATGIPVVWISATKFCRYYLYVLRGSYTYNLLSGQIVTIRHFKWTFCDHNVCYFGRIKKATSLSNCYIYLESLLRDNVSRSCIFIFLH